MSNEPKNSLYHRYTSRLWSDAVSVKKIHNHPNLSLDIVVTGMHLMNEFGNTINEIQQDDFHYHIVDVHYKEDTKEAMATFIGEFIQKLIPVVSSLEPDIILVLGDRGEMLAGAIVGVYLSRPVAHIHGGEITSTVDDIARHAITKLSHIHFPATEESRDRIIRMGENPDRIFVVGAPGLDQILEEPLLSREELEEKYHLDFSNPVILLVQHPVTLELDFTQEQIKQILKAIAALKYQTIVIYPNADAGGRKIIDEIKKYKNVPFIQIHKNIMHRDYLSLLKNVTILVGNSSSGIIEAASFGLPVLNIGSRQRGRQRGRNVIDVDYNCNQIEAKIRSVIEDEEFRNLIKKQPNPYGDGSCGKKLLQY